MNDKNRRKLRLDVPGVNNLLPEYYATEYGVDSGSLIKLLDLYYDYLDSDGVNSFHNEISNIFLSRDISETDETYLDQLVREVGNGLQSSSFFQNPRLMAKLIPLFYKSKGTILSTEGFFRGFFGEEIEVQFPKDQLLHVGGIDPTGKQGRIGFDFQNRILDNGIYQIFSILIKSGLSVSDYETLYTRFVHPGGFHFSGLVGIEGDAISTLLAEGVNPIESSVGDILIIDEATQIITTAFTQMTALFDSSGVGYPDDPNTDGVFRLSLSVADAIERYKNITIDKLSEFYASSEELGTPNSFTLDNNRRRRVFDVASEHIAFSNTNGTNDGPGSTTPNAGLPTLRLVGTIAEWNTGDNSNFEDYWSTVDRIGTPPNTGTMALTSSDGFIDSNENIMVAANNNFIAADSGEGYDRHYTTKYTVDLSDVTEIIYWTNKGGSGWGNDAQNGEDLVLSFGKTLDTDGTILNPSTLNTVLGSTAVSNQWDKNTITITGVADSDVYLEFSQTGTQFGDVKDNWAFTSVYVDESYDSVGPDMSLGTETMDNDMFTRYLSDSAI